MPPALAATDLLFSGPLVVAVLISAAAGLVSFFSPCCLPLVPGYLSYVAGLAGAETRAETQIQVPIGVGAPATSAPESRVVRQPARGRTLLGGALFVAGFAAVFTSYGAAFGAVGSLFLEHQQMLIRILGVITILLGLVFTGLLWRIPLAGRSFRLGYRPRAGLIGAPLVGNVRARVVSLHRPTLGVILTLATSSGSAGRGAALTFAYSVGWAFPS